MRALFRIAWRNVFINWRHSLAALLSVGAGFVSLCLFQCYMLGVRDMYEKTYFSRGMFGHLFIENPISQTVDGKRDVEKYFLHKEEQEFIDGFLASDPVFQTRVRFLKVSGMVTNGKASTIFGGYGYDLKEGAEVRRPAWEWNTVAGKPLQLATTANAVAIGKSLGRILGCVPLTDVQFINGIGGYAAFDRPFKCVRSELQFSAMTETGQLNAIDLNVEGLVDAAYKDIDTKFTVMSLESAQMLFNTHDVSYYTVVLKHKEDIPAFVARFDQASKQRNLSLRAIRWQDHPAGELYARTMELLTIFRNFVVAVILTIAGLSVLNSMIKIVKERTREIGTLRSLGFKRPQVIFLFTVEAALLAALGCAAGLLVTIGMTYSINKAGILYKAGLLTEPVPFLVAWSPVVYTTSIILLCGIAIVAAYIPAVTSAHKKIADCMTHT